MSEKTQNDVQHEDLVFDVRLMPHSIRRGRLSHDAVNKHLADLPDDEEEGEEMAVRFSTPYANRADDEGN